MVKATGFREYDARWLFGKEINLMGIQALGMGLGALIAELGVKQEIVTGHDFRGYSSSIKYALITGLMAAGCKVHDIVLALTPMSYFAQFELDVPCVAMVTASHNDNGWTGVKMGANRPLTFGPDEMTRLRDIVLDAAFKPKAGGTYDFIEDFPARYIADLTNRPKIRRKLKVVCACGNGTAGARSCRGRREVRTLLLQQADGTRLRRWVDFRACGLRHARPQSGKVHGGFEERAAEDLGFAHHVAALRRRNQIRRGRRRGEALPSPPQR